jgi:hypothetical protein
MNGACTGHCHGVSALQLVQTAIIWLVHEDLSRGIASPQALDKTDSLQEAAHFRDKGDSLSLLCA